MREKTVMNGGGALKTDKWVLCPIRGNKTRIKVRSDTVLENFPLFCCSAQNVSRKQ